MKLPNNLAGMTLSNDGHIFPPFGFITIDETGDGGGDYYGMYWEIGKEEFDPIVCALQHEEFYLSLNFQILKHLLIGSTRHKDKKVHQEILMIMAFLSHY